MNIIASSNGAIVGGIFSFLFVIIGVAWLAFWIWLVIIAIQYLRWGRKAFERYVGMTEPEWQYRHRSSSNPGISTPPGRE